MVRSTDSRRDRNSDSVMIGGRRRPVSRPSRRRCFLASSRVEPLTDRTSSWRGGLAGAVRLANVDHGIRRVIGAELGSGHVLGRTAAPLAPALAYRARLPILPVGGVGVVLRIAVLGRLGGSLRSLLSGGVLGRAGPPGARTRRPGPRGLRLVLGCLGVRAGAGPLGVLGRRGVSRFGRAVLAGPGPAAAGPAPAAAPGTRIVVIDAVTGRVAVGRRPGRVLGGRPAAWARRPRGLDALAGVDSLGRVDSLGWAAAARP